MLQHTPRHHFAPDADAVSSVERTDGPGWKRPMPRVSSMLFELELEDQEACEDAAAPQISRQLFKLLQPRSQAEHQLGVAVNSAYESACARGCVLSIDDLAERLRGRGYDVRIRTALGGGGGGECLRNLRHQFLTLNMTGPAGSRLECIIDPSFAEQWGIARPTPAYARVVAALPQVYVGSSVEPLVDYLCSELAAAFREEGTTLPPWRAADAMLSKWRPRRSVDCDMLAHTAGGFAETRRGAVPSSLSRRSGSFRPTKSQRLSASVGVPAARLASPRSAFAAASPRSRSSFAPALNGSSPRSGAGSYSSGSRRGGGVLLAAGRPLALDKSVSKALSDAEAYEAAAALLADAEAVLEADGFGDAEVSDSSNDSEAGTLGFAPRVQPPSGRSTRRGSGNAGTAASDLSTLSCSWRASDCTPFGALPRGASAAPRCTPRSPTRGTPQRGDAERTSLEGVSTSDGSDTTQGGPPADQALQSQLPSAPPRLPGGSPGASLLSTLPPAARSPSAPPLPLVPEFGFAKPAPAKSALNFARKSGGRTVKCVPPLEASMGGQTSFARRPAAPPRLAEAAPCGAASGELFSAVELFPTSGGGWAAGASAAESAAPPFGTSPARKSFMVRQQLGLATDAGPKARRPLEQQPQVEMLW